jgi:hypothetical protein
MVHQSSTVVHLEDHQGNIRPSPANFRHQVAACIPVMVGLKVTGKIILFFTVFGGKF